MNFCSLFISFGQEQVFQLLQSINANWSVHAAPPPQVQSNHQSSFLSKGSLHWCTKGKEGGVKRRDWLVLKESFFQSSMVAIVTASFVFSIQNSCFFWASGGGYYGGNWEGKKHHSDHGKRFSIVRSFLFKWV